MAADIFCKIDGIAGESTDDKHVGEIELQSFSLGFSQSAMVATSAVGGSTGARVDLSEFTVSKMLDASSPTLAKFCCSGKHIATITITVSGANEAKETYLQYVLSDVVVAAVQLSGGGGGIRPQESVSFRYGTIAMIYTPYDATGKKGTDGKMGWSAVTNKSL